ncbi:hypothetical protein HK096_006459 [Nowakowskiella sp. JEL0078]|nr:hypothetical protein HK096_006459 [Nowakowskiella sp. JEL0078]
MDSLSQYDISAFVDLPDDKDFSNLPSILPDTSFDLNDFSDLSYHSLSPPNTISSPSPSPVNISIDNVEKFPSEIVNTIPSIPLFPPPSQPTLPLEFITSMYGLAPSPYLFPPMSLFPPSPLFPKSRQPLKPQFFNDGANSSEDEEMEDVNKKSIKSMVSQSKSNVTPLAERRRKESPTPFELETLEKSMNSKERRQLRNKISARNFRLRRKEYITNLEDELKIVTSENEKMRSALLAIQNENFLLCAELGLLKQFGGVPGVAPLKPFPQFPANFSTFLPNSVSQQEVSSVKLENPMFPPALPPIGPSKCEPAVAAADGRIKVHSVRLGTPEIPLCVAEKMMGRGDAATCEIDDVATMLRKTVREIIPAVDAWDGIGKRFDEEIVWNTKKVDFREKQYTNTMNIPGDMVVTRFLLLGFAILGITEPRFLSYTLLTTLLLFGAWIIYLLNDYYYKLMFDEVWRPRSSNIKLPSTWKWNSSGILVEPQSDDLHKGINVKDPTIVLLNGVYHVYATTSHYLEGSDITLNMVYFNFTEFSQANFSKQYYMDQTKGFEGYKCAPQLFYFAPHKKWYLIFQSPKPMYSTNDDPGNPQGWTDPKAMIDIEPEFVRKRNQPGSLVGWIDFWVICDDILCNLFFSNDNGYLFQSITKKSQFPYGWGDINVALYSGRLVKYFEASMLYKLRGRKQYLLVVESIDDTQGDYDVRYFHSLTSTSLSGPWIPLSGDETKPFAGDINVNFTTTKWATGISHGELLRSSNNEYLEINPCGLKFVYQGLIDGTWNPYDLRPYRLGLLTSDTHIKGC